MTDFFRDVKNQFDEEQTARAGLQLAGYRGKWEQAKRLALANERTDDNRLLPYWERVRLLFLELGGEPLALKDNADLEGPDPWPAGEAEFDDEFDQVNDNDDDFHLDDYDDDEAA